MDENWIKTMNEQWQNIINKNQLFAFNVIVVCNLAKTFNTTPLKTPFSLLELRQLLVFNTLHVIVAREELFITITARPPGQWSLPTTDSIISDLHVASLPTPDLAGRSPLPPPPALRVIGLCAATSAVLATYLRPQVPWLSLTVCPQYSSFVSWRSSNEQNQKLLLSHFARCHCDSRFHADWRRRSLVGISVINSYDFFLPGAIKAERELWWWL